MATAPTARTSRSATSTTTPTSRSSPPSTTTRSTRSSLRRHLGPRLALVRQPRSPAPRASRMGWRGPVHPVGGSQGRAAPLPPAHGGFAEAGGPHLAAVDRVAAGSGQLPRQRRPQRGDRAAQRRAAHPLPHPGVRVHGARRGVRRRASLSARRQARPRASRSCRCPTTRSTAPAATGTRPTGIPAPTMVDIVGNDRPEIVAALPGGKVYAVFSGRATSCGPRSTRRGVRRPSPPRWSRPTSTRTAGPARLRHLRAAPQRQPPRSSSRRTARSSRSPG